MSRTDFLPRRQADLLHWSRTMRERLLADPQRYGMTAALAATYAEVHDRFAAAYALAVNGSTRGPKNTIAKDTAMRELRTLARKYAAMIQYAPNVTAGQKRELGLSLRKRGGKPIPVPPPRFPPRAEVRIEHGRVLHIRLHDQLRPHRRGKPDGVRGALVFRYIGDDPPRDIAAWTLLGTMSRCEGRTVLPLDLQPGQRIWIAACWVNPRGERGPMSQMRSVRINFDTLPTKARQPKPGGLRIVQRQLQSQQRAAA